MRRLSSMLGSLLLVLTGSCGDPEPSGFEGLWVGALESGTLPSGSTRVALDIEAAAIGEPVVATVVFGEGAPPAEPTDPDVGWPMGVDPQLESVPVADGYVYGALDGTRTGDRLQIDVAVTELWESWCALQTPYPVGDGSPEAQCLPNRPWDASPFGCVIQGDADNPEMPVDCLKLTLCRRTRVCSCTTTDGCAPSTTGLTLTIDVMIDGDEATGTIRWVSEDPELSTRTARVRLNR